MTLTLSPAGVWMTRQEELKIPAKQPKKGKLWLADGSCVGPCAERPDHVWSYDFVEDRTHEGRSIMYSTPSTSSDMDHNLRTRYVAGACPHLAEVKDDAYCS